MNKTLIPKEALLSAGKEIVAQSGIQSLNMREVAQKCGIAVGSIYNYFPSKGDFIIATIESIWAEIMKGLPSFTLSISFTENIILLFDNIQKVSKKYPSFLQLHSMSLTNTDKIKGRETMHLYFSNIKRTLLEALNQDPNVIENNFSNNFTKSDFVDFVFSNILMLLTNGESSCDFLLEIIKRIIYK
ncbi:MAG: TetR/AcrR family transcriptional regulator [Caloramator sp.]|nr:TetR/AcrR family transcriptional regulator [Caloramator sp.]